MSVCARVLAGLLAVVTVLGAGAARAQSFPTRPITIVVTSGPGGMDTLVRLIGPLVSESLGQPLVIENKPGANGVIGVQQVAAAVPDGHTLLFASISTLTINPFVYKNISYDPLRDLEPIARHVTLPMVWAANPGRGFKSLPDLVAHARAHPGALTMGNPGPGSYGHLLEEALKQKNGIDALVVPFKSAPAAINDVVGGFVDVCVDNISNLSGLLQEGKLTPLAVTSRERASALPQAASWLEDGTGPFEASAWYAFMAPKGTPPAVIERLNTAINQAIGSPTLRQRWVELNGQFTPFMPDGLRAFIKDEMRKYGELAAAAKIVPQ